MNVVDLDVERLARDVHVHAAHMQAMAAEFEALLADPASRSWLMDNLDEFVLYVTTVRDLLHNAEAYVEAVKA